MTRRGAGDKRRDGQSSRDGRARRGDEQSQHARRDEPLSRQRGDTRREAAHDAADFASHQTRPAQGERESHLYGVSPVLEALRAGSRPIERITLAEGAHGHRLHELLQLARDARVPVRRVARVELNRAAEGANHQGVIALVGAARYRDEDELLAELAARVGTDDPPLALVLDGVEDPRNLGAIVRTAECAGAHAVFVPERRAAPLTETVAKAAAGALEYVPVARAVNVARLIEELKARGVWVVGAAAEAEQDYAAWDWSQPTALVLGGEGRGLRRLVRESCDALVRIPLRGRISSLNVSVSAGVLLYEALRQRTARGADTYNDARIQVTEKGADEPGDV